MKFDKNRIYSAVNADELKPGDRVIVADSLASLKSKIEDLSYTTELLGIRDEST